MSWYWPPKPVEKKIKDDDDEDDGEGGSSRDGLRTEAYDSEEDEEEVEDEVEEDSYTVSFVFHVVSRFGRLEFISFL